MLIFEKFRAILFQIAPTRQTLRVCRVIFFRLPEILNAVNHQIMQRQQNFLAYQIHKALRIIRQFSNPFGLLDNLKNCLARELCFALDFVQHIRYFPIIFQRVILRINFFAPNAVCLRLIDFGFLHH